MSVLIQVRKRDDWTVVILRGRLDGLSTSELVVALAMVLAERPPRLALDLAKITYLSSIGLRSLLELRKACASWRGQVRLVAPQPAVLEVLEAAGFTQLFEISEDLAG
jgi:anti-anti-sigma factor